MVYDPIKGKIYREKHREKRRLGGIRWREENKEKDTERHIKYREENRERIAAYDRWYRKKNKEKVYFWGRHREYLKKNCVGSHTFQEWEDLKKQYNHTCLCCKRREPEIKLCEDHIIPLSKGGGNYINNIQPLCRQCNTKKMQKTIDYRVSWKAFVENQSVLETV
jgi:5-methylcytosine-specific restriction endonuclease McrA